MSTDGGATWTQGSVPAGTGILRAARCAGTSCLAVGTNSTVTSILADAPGTLLVSLDGGDTWLAGTSPGGMGDGAALACPSTELCAAVGTTWAGNPAVPQGGVATTVDGGTAWTTPEERYLAEGLADVSCPSAKWCITVGGNSIARITLPSLPRPKAAEPGKTERRSTASRGRPPGRPGSPRSTTGAERCTRRMTHHRCPSMVDQ